MLNRRETLIGLSGLLAMPALARAGSLMRVSPIIHPEKIKDAIFGYRGHEMSNAFVEFDDGTLRQYRSASTIRRVVRQVESQMGLAITRDRPVRAVFGSNSLYRGTNFEKPIKGSKVQLTISRDPHYEFLLEENSPSARVQYDHFRPIILRPNQNV